MLTSGEPLRRDPSASAENWQEPPVNRWSFWHVRELLPTHPVPRGDGPVRPLPDHPGDQDVLAVEVTRVDGSRATVGDVLDRHLDRRVRRAAGRSPRRRGLRRRPAGRSGPTRFCRSPSRWSAAWPGSWSTAGCSTPTSEVTEHVPELAASGYAGATVQHLLDMRSGVRFREDYTDPDAEVRQLDRWIAERRALPVPGDAACRRRRTGAGSSTGPRRPTCSAGCASGPVAPGWPTCSPTWSGRRWAPSRTPRSSATRLGTAVHDGGLAATARDLLRFGQMLLDGGAVPDGDERCAQRRTARVAAARLGRRRGGTVAVPRVAGRGVLPGRVVPQPVLVPARASTATCCSASASTARWCTSAAAPARCA